MTATGELAWVPDVSIDLDVDAKSFNTTQFTPEWPAELTGKVKLKVAIQQDKLRGALDIVTLNGKVRGYPFSGSGQVSLLDDDFQFKNLQLVASGNRVNVNGQASEPFDLSWEVDAKNISKLALGIDGSVTANGTLTGSVANPILNGKLRANRLAFQGQRLESAQADIRTADGQYFLDGKLQGLLVNGERFSSATVVGRGDVDKHAASSLKPLWRSKAATSGSRPRKATKESIAGREPPCCRTCSRKSLPTVGENSPSSSKRPKASADSTSAHL